MCWGPGVLRIFRLPAGSGGCAIEFYFDFISSWTLIVKNTLTGGNIFLKVIENKGLHNRKLLGFILWTLLDFLDVI